MSFSYKLNFNHTEHAFHLESRKNHGYQDFQADW